MNTILKSMIEFFKRYKFRILNLLVLTTIIYPYFGYGLGHFKITFLVFSLFNAFLIQTILFSTGKSKILFFPILLIISTIISIEITHIEIYSDKITFGEIASTFETNQDEAINMLSSLKSYLPLFLSIWIILVSSCFIANREYQKNKQQLKNKYKLIVILVGIICIFVKTYRTVYSDEKTALILENEFRAYPLLSISQYSIEGTTPCFFGTTSLALCYIYEIYKLQNSLSYPQKFPNCLHTPKKDQNNTPQTIFLVIGESSNRDNYSLYGYNIETTPYLDSLNIQNKVLYYKALSPACITRDAIPFIMTFSTPFDIEKEISEKNIVTLAKDMGYETIWISNQGKIGASDSPIGRIASRADYTTFSNIESSLNNSNYDISLVEVTKQMYKPEKKQLFILHLRGSHQNYKNGYDYIDTKITNRHNYKSENLDYDRTIHHTDRVLAELYDSFFDDKKKNDSINKILFYLPDHGEIVDIGHGIINPSMDQFKIPFIILGSYYFPQVDSLVNKYMNDSFFNSSNFPYVFSEIIGYHVKNEYIDKIREEGLYYKRADSKILKFPKEI